MPIDASIYSNVQPVKVDMPSPMDAAQKAMTLSELGMRQRQMTYQMGAQMATRKAIADNTDETGNVNKQGALSQLGKMGWGQQAMDLGQQFASQDKAQAEARSASADAENKAVGVALPELINLKGASDAQRPLLYHQMLQRLADKGLPMHNVPPDYTDAWLDDTIKKLQNTPTYQDMMLKQSEIAKNTTEANLAPVKLQGEMFGSRSPNVTATDQYSNEPSVKIARGSQVAMGQMVDNFNHPTPQGDASLMLNAYKIKFPNAPDVNSLDELSKSQSVPDQWKQAISHRVNGLFDENTRNNLMRDGISTFRANVGGLRDTQQKYQDWARSVGIPAPNTNESAIDKLEAKTSALQDKLGPYVPPAQRTGGLLGSAAQMLGMGGSQAKAAEKPAAPKATAGAIVNVGGKHYRVGADGDTLEPITGKKR